MGRVARPAIRAALADPAFEVTLLTDGAAASLHGEFPNARVARVRTIARAGRYDVVWFPFNGMPRRSAAPAVVTVHDTFAFAYPHPGRIARFREQAPIRRAAREATRLIAVSHYTRDALAATLRPNAPIDVVRSAPDPYFTRGDDAPLPPPLESIRFALVVGARETRKNVRLALDACATLRAPHEALVIVGTLDARERERARRRNRPAGEITPSDAMLRALYRRARVVLVPSLAEGFGLVAVEAMACGAPVYAASGSALEEACDGAATVLDPHDVDAWSTAIRSIFDDDELAASLRARASARFDGPDRTTHARRVLDIVRDVAR